MLFDTPSFSCNAVVFGSKMSRSRLSVLNGSMILEITEYVGVLGQRFHEYLKQPESIVPDRTFSLMKFRLVGRRLWRSSMKSDLQYHIVAL